MEALTGDHPSSPDAIQAESSDVRLSLADRVLAKLDARSDPRQETSSEHRGRQALRERNRVQAEASEAPVLEALTAAGAHGLDPGELHELLAGRVGGKAIQRAVIRLVKRGVATRASERGRIFLASALREPAPAPAPAPASTQLPPDRDPRHRCRPPAEGRLVFGLSWHCGENAGTNGGCGRQWTWTRRGWVPWDSPAGWEAREQLRRAPRPRLVGFEIGGSQGRRSGLDLPTGFRFRPDHPLARRMTPS